MADEILIINKDKMDHILEDEVSEFVWKPIGNEDQQEDDRYDRGAIVTKTSRKLPEVWTRVISIFGDNLTLGL